MKLFVALLAVSSFACAYGASFAEPVEPLFDAYSQVQMMLSTRENANNPVRLNFRDINTLRASPYNPAKPTRFLIHGWWENGDSDMNVETSRELLEIYDFNIILVDWSDGSRLINYVQAVARVPVVGVFLASYCDWLNEAGYLDFNRVSVIGFSLGAHMAGVAGKNLRRGRFNTIVGLDPAGQMFSVNQPNNRLDAADAEWVEAIHTNGGALGLGIGAPIADADFFPNGGSLQPGCITNACHHIRAVNLFIDSLRSHNSMYGLRCVSHTDAMLGRCNSEPGVWFGGEPSNNGRAWAGLYHFTTNNAAPFGRGPTRPSDF